MEINTKLPLIGVVSSRQCPVCGHHEVGITTPDGSFYPLKPGTLVQTLETEPVMGPALNEIRPQSNDNTQESGDESMRRPWAPDPVRGDRTLRLKYGVMVKENIDKINGAIYQSAFLDKLRNLIEKEIHIPLAVILDRFFNTPHLASGNPENVVFAMWQELEEIRKPVDLVKDWIENPGEEQLDSLLNPYSKDGISNEPVSDEELKKDLEQLSLEEFLGLL